MTGRPGSPTVRTMKAYSLTDRQNATEKSGRTSAGTAWMSAEGPADDPCFRYAISECRRILRRLGWTVRQSAPVRRRSQPEIRIALGVRSETRRAGGAAELRGIRHDGFLLEAAAGSLRLAAREPKGLLNAVYDAAERLGVRFLLPGEAGERIPERMRRLPPGRRVCNPVFPHRGVYWEGENDRDYSDREWLEFYAKLKFNAVRHLARDRALARRLGLRLETGGHGLSQLVSRRLFRRRPELFRLGQPEDFKGQRMPDANFCVTNPGVRKLIETGYRKLARANAGVHALHLWPDDLPSGGWCMCPSCRAFSPRDQAMLALRHQAPEAAKAGLRLPFLAYHDTLFPGTQIPPPREAFLLYAPRERCYGHALDDPGCPLNRRHLAALRAWRRVFRRHDDAHTFEYYFDQLLFRGLYPFLPGVIRRDLRVYRAHGIECSLSLQVGGPAVAPEYNMLFFAKAHWDAGLQPRTFIRDLATDLDPDRPAAWERYLTERAAVFTDALCQCGQDPDIYFDYRWLPETTTAFGRDRAAAYARASRRLARAATSLDAAPAARGAATALARREAARARFEAAELRGMAFQQDGVNRLARAHCTGDSADRRRAAAALRRAIAAFRHSRTLAARAGLSPAAWYCRNIQPWILRELAEKIERHRTG